MKGDWKRYVHSLGHRRGDVVVQGGESADILCVENIVGSFSDIIIQIQLNSNTVIHWTPKSRHWVSSLCSTHLEHFQVATYDLVFYSLSPLSPEIDPLCNGMIIRVSWGNGSPGAQTSEWERPGPSVAQKCAKDSFFQLEVMVRPACMVEYVDDSCVDCKRELNCLVFRENKKFMFRVAKPSLSIALCQLDLKDFDPGAHSRWFRKESFSWRWLTSGSSFYFGAS